MKADFTRKTSKPGKHYSGVLMQQGRVQLDADWNEQAAIQLNFTRQLAADSMGPHGGPPAGLSGKVLTPPNPSLVPAFSVLPLPQNATQTDFLLLPGHYYVDGVLCSNETTPAIVTGYDDTSNLYVFTWTTDGIPFAIGQYLWLFCSDTTKDAPAGDLVNTVLQISAVDYTHRKLTVTTIMGDVTPFINGANGGSPQRHFVRRAPSYLTQPDMPGATLAQLTKGPYQVYLDVWERAVTSIEDDAIREVALNGADTAARSKVVAQVKLTAPNPSPADKDHPCYTPYELAELFQPSNRGCLMARTRPSRGNADPCTISPDAGYYGPENQLYRVEIDTGSLDPVTNARTAPTFKWSRENGSAVYAIAGGGGTSVITLESLGRDDRFGLNEGDWVEILDDDYILQNRAAPLRQVTGIDRVRMTVTLSGSPDNTVGGDPTKHPYIRRWEHKAGDPAQGGLTLSATDNAALIFPQVQFAAAAVRQVGAQGIPINPVNRSGTGADQVFGVNRPAAVQQNTTWLDLEDGVQVQFTAPPYDSTTPSAQFRTGDYWLIPARVATGDVEWPTEQVPNATAGQAATAPVAMPPDGVTHHYAPLAMITVNGDGITVDEDCGVAFAPTFGVLYFQQNGVGYSNAIAEQIETAPTQASATPELARVAKPAAAKKKAAKPAQSS